MIRKSLKVIGLVLLLLALAVGGRTVSLRSRQLPAGAAPKVGDLPVDATAAAARLASALRIPTVSHEEGANVEAAAFAALHQYLAATFPLAHAALRREVVNGSSLLYTWPGSDPSLPPLLLLSHQDVVPVEPGTEGAWTHPPFFGDVAEGYIWGRGSLDDKAGVVGILEAVELLLRQPPQGLKPKRTILLAFGHDEEIGGERGASRIAALLESRRVRPQMILDEGGLIAQGLVPGLAKPVALIGTAEKGFVSVELSADAAGGHSSMPPRHTALGLVARAIERLEDHPMPARIAGPTAQSFAFLAPEMPFVQRAVLGNLWLFGPLVRAQGANEASTGARLRTTTAATVFQGGVKDNVLPHHARAVVNFRILQGDTVATVLEHVKATVGPEVKVKISGSFSAEPSPEAAVDGPAFRELQTTIAQVLPGTLVAPNLLVGATDSRHYRRLTNDIYRFLPMRLGPGDLDRLHGTNERIGVESYAEAIRFYAQLIRRAAG